MSRRVPAALLGGLTGAMLVASIGVAGRAEASAAEQRLAVVVGNNEGERGEVPLEYAEADARRFHRLLLELAHVTPSDALLLEGTTATADAVRAALERVRSRVAERRGAGSTALVFYVSSHADAEALHLGGTRLPLSELRARVEASGAEFRLAILDACRTPVRLKGGQARTSEVPVRLEAPAQVEGSLFLLSAAEGEPAQEWPYLRGSLFTHHLLGGLRGLADLDENGVVTLGEAYGYAYRHTVSQSVTGQAGAQHPSFDVKLQGWGEWVFARPAAQASSLVLGEELDGSIWVADASAELVAEVKKAKGTRTRLSLRPGRYRVVRPRSSHADATDVLLSSSAVRELRQGDFVQVPLERARLRGPAPLVLRPWEVQLSYALSSESVSGAGPQHFAELGLRRRFASLYARARVGYAQGAFHTDALAVHQHEGQLALAGGYVWDLWPAEVSLGLELRGTLVRQRVRRADGTQAEDIFGVREPLRSDVVWGGGPLLGVSTPLTERLRVGAEVAAGVARVPRWDGTTVNARSAQLRLGLGWAF